MKRDYTLQEANQVLHLVQVISDELVERRNELRSVRRQRQQLAEARTPEGLSLGLAELDIRAVELEEAITRCRHELEDLGMTVLRTTPLTVHIPGQSRSGPVVFCWEESESPGGHAIESEREEGGWESAEKEKRHP